MSLSKRPSSSVVARIRIPLLVAALGAWASAVGAGMFLLSAYAATPGAATNPAKFEAPRLDASQEGAYRLLMFAHPRCPCTAASLQELARIMARCDGRVAATVRFYRPAGVDDDWAHSALYATAAAIPGVHVELDPDGECATRFGSNVSGEALLYDPAGNLRFRGGITPARGHEGDSVGKSAVISIVEGDVTDVTGAPAFGCGLRSTKAENDD